MIRQNNLIFLLVIIQVALVEAQNPILKYIDSLVANAIIYSEKELYNARLDKAKEIIQTSRFENFDGYSARHEILLTMQGVRINKFIYE